MQRMTAGIDHDRPSPRRAVHLELVTEALPEPLAWRDRVG